MKAERQSKSASCDIMTAMRAMNVRLCGLAYVDRADSQSSRADDQQAAEHEVGHGHGQLGRGLLGVPNLVRPTQLDRGLKRNERLPPLLGKFE